MAKVIADMSMSLDGYVADENDGVNEVFAWYTTGPEMVEIANEMEMQMTEQERRAFKEGIAGVGAVLSGRRTSDLAGAWGGQHPVGVPTYVVSHRPPPEDLDPETSTVDFVDGIEEAVRQAKESAGEKSVGVAGGDTVRQLLDARAARRGPRLARPRPARARASRSSRTSENAPIQLEGPEVTEGDGVTHLHYRVAR